MKYKMARFTLFVSTLFLLSACASVPDIIPNISLPTLPSLDKFSAPNGSDIESANALLEAGKRPEAAEAYFVASRNYPSPQRERLILQAAELASLFKDSNLTRRYLLPLNFPALSDENKARFRFTQAKLAINDRNHREALRILPQRVNGLPDGLASKILSARLAAAKSSGDRLSLVQELVMQEPKLATDQVSLNQDRIWNHIQQMPLNQISDGRKTIKHKVLTSWLDLGLIVKHNNTNKDNLRKQLVVWQQRNPKHPGNKKIQQITNTATSTVTTPYRGGSNTAPVVTKAPVQRIVTAPTNTNQVAVILPLTGNLSEVGNTLLKGIQQAQKQYAKNMNLKVYNSATGPIGSIYQSAINNGAGFVIGPFDKRKITELAGANLPKPTMALNTINKTGSNLYQFGLSPEDEAKQMVEYALNSSQRRIAILTPKSAWGSRLQSVIRKSIIERNSKISLMESYDTNANDYLLLANKVAQRTSEIDAIIIAATPTQARKLYPALREKIRKLPIYGTSHVFSGLANASQDNILNGLIYTETPGVLSSLHQSSKTKGRFPRLFDMGMDALIIAKDFQRLQKFGQSFKGKSGNLAFSKNGRVSRNLRLAQFKNGIPAPY